MPRYSLDLDSLSADLASNQLSSSTRVQLLKENVDLEKAFGISAHFAETVRLTYEELRDASRMDECDMLSMILCCDTISRCCESCCRDNDTSSTEHKKDKKDKKSSLAEVPTQEVMHDAPNEIQPSLLERLAQLSSDDVRKMMHSKGAGKMEKFGMFLFKKKFGEEETKHMQECAETVKKVGPDLVEKDKLDIDDLVKKTKQADVKAFAKLMRVLGTAFMAKHGQSIHEKGLDAVGLGSCAHVLCAGSMKYELDPTGLHKCVSTIVAAIQMGYRTLDTALIYGNHGMVREAIEESGIQRDELFLTSKVGFFPSSMDLPQEHQAAFGVATLPMPADLPFHPLNVKGKEIEAIELSLKELGVDYLDLCLIHVPATSALELSASFFPHLYHYWPKMPMWTETSVVGALKALAMQEVKTRQSQAKQERKRSWQNMERAKRRGLCRHIGVSNYPVEFMKEIDEYKTEPIYNEQQELHPLAQSRDVQDYARKAKVSLTGYGTGVVASAPLAKDIAHKINRTPGQVLLRWAVQKGIHVNPKSNQVSRLKENLEVLDFALDDEDMSALDGLDVPKIFYWNTSVLVPQASAAKEEL